MSSNLLHLAAALLATLVFAAPAFAQSTPQAALDSFIELANAGQLTAPEGQALLTGEASQLATDAKSNLSPADRVIRVAPDKAAARIVLRNRPGEEADAYFYLDRVSDRWAVSAYRMMPRAGIDIMLLDEMKKRPKLTPDDQVSLRNLQLILATDAKLHDWFKANRAKLDDLAKTWLAQSAPRASPAATLTDLGLTAIEAFGDGVMIIIGVSSGATVGLIRPGPSAPSKINPVDFIWVEDLGNGWFLFRKI